MINKLSQYATELEKQNKHFRNKNMKAYEKSVVKLRRLKEELLE